jgi:hypothetical protein
MLKFMLKGQAIDGDLNYVWTTTFDQTGGTWPAMLVNRQFVVSQSGVSNHFLICCVR